MFISRTRQFIGKFFNAFYASKLQMLKEAEIIPDASEPHKRNPKTRPTSRKASGAAQFKRASKKAAGRAVNKARHAA